MPRRRGRLDRADPAAGSTSRPGTRRSRCSPGMAAAPDHARRRVGLLRTLPAPGALGGGASSRRTAATARHRLAGRRHRGPGAGRPAAGHRRTRSRCAGRPPPCCAGAGYAAFDRAAGAAPPADPGHGGIGAPYAHVTAPLRRLVDRFGTEVCLAVAAGARAAGVAARRAADAAGGDGGVRRGGRARWSGPASTAPRPRCWPSGSATEFAAVVLRPRGPEGEPGEVFLAEPPVLARCTGSLRAGEMVRVELVEADPATGRIAFRARVRPPLSSGACTSGTASSTSSRSCAADGQLRRLHRPRGSTSCRPWSTPCPRTRPTTPTCGSATRASSASAGTSRATSASTTRASWCAATPRASRCAPASTTRSRRPSPRWAPTSTCWPPSSAGAGCATCAIGFNPLRSEYVIDPPLGEWERAHRIGSPEERTAHLHMVTYGPDLNLSADGLRRARRGPEAHPLQPVARAAVVLLAVPRRGAVGRALGAHPPAHGRPARRAGVPRPGRRADRRPTRRSPSPRGCPPRSAGWSSRRSTRSATSPSTASCSACSPGWSSTTPCPDGAPPRTRRRTGTSRRWASPTTRCTARPAHCSTAAERALAGRAADLARLAGLRARWARRECAATSDARGLRGGRLAGRGGRRERDACAAEGRRIAPAASQV